MRRALASSLLALLALSAWQALVGAALLRPFFETENSSFLALLNDLSVGYILSYIFYILVVSIPERERRKQFRRWLRAQHENLKLRLIEIYLTAIGDSWDSDLPRSLLEPKAFDDYFAARYSDDQTRWHAVHNGLYEYGLPQVVLECELFVREVQFGLARSPLDDAQALDYLAALSRRLSRLQTAQPDYNDIKAAMRMLYSIHSPWDAIEGKKVADKISEMIDRL